jgi:hypothetical protein
MQRTDPAYAAAYANSFAEPVGASPLHLVFWPTLGTPNSYSAMVVALLSAADFCEKFVPSTVRGGLGDLPETLAEIFRPLLGPLPRRLYLRRFELLLAVGPIPKLPEFSAGLRVQNGSMASSMGSPRWSDRTLA